MSSIWGKNLKIAIFGESHGAAIGVTVDGLPPGEKVDRSALADFMARRAPGRNRYSTARKETDAPEFISGLLHDCTTGAPLTAIIRNSDIHSGDYSQLRDIPRPGHADYTAQLRYHGYQDARGGGHFSGRLTAPLCVAGAIAMQILARRNITIGAHLLSIGNVSDRAFDSVNPTADELRAPGLAPFPVIDEAAGAAMREAIAEAARQSDSLGGMIETAAIGVPGGCGSPIFDGVENRLASLFFGIPAVRGVEFGTGMAAAGMRGSEHNDPFTVCNGRIRTSSNHHGGILGGITSGMPVIAKIAFKPTPSIFRSQPSVNLQTMQDCELVIRGRHDPCIAPRAVPVVEAAMAVGLLDLLLDRYTV